MTEYLFINQVLLPFFELNFFINPQILRYQFQGVKSTNQKPEVGLIEQEWYKIDIHIIFVT